MTEDDQEDIFDRLAFLEKEVRRLERLVEFWHGKVPLKYKKAFPEPDENPYFTHEKFLPKTPECIRAVDSFGKTWSELDIPKDPRELQNAKERMAELSKRASEAASSTSSEQQDSHQEHTYDEFDPS